MAKLSGKSSISKPYPHFPLTPHPSGRWCKKILGKLHYFGPLADWKKALQLYLNQKDDLHAGRLPRARRESLTIEDLCNRFLTAKECQMHQDELRPATFHDYYKACIQISGYFGKTHWVDDLRAEDFGALWSALAQRLSIVGLTNAITRTKVVFKWAYENQLVERPVRCGTEFNPPSARARRLDKASKPVRLFEAADMTTHTSMLKTASAATIVAGGLASYVDLVLEYPLAASQATAVACTTVTAMATAALDHRVDREPQEGPDPPAGSKASDKRLVPALQASRESPLIVASSGLQARG